MTVGRQNKEKTAKGQRAREMSMHGKESPGKDPGDRESEEGDGGIHHEYPNSKHRDNSVTAGDADDKLPMAKDATKHKPNGMKLPRVSGQETETA